MKSLSALILTAILGLVCRAAEPSPITEVRVKETTGHTYLCLKKELKLAEMSEFAVAAITELFQKSTEQKLGQGGPVMFTYFNFTGDPDQKFTAEIALPINKKEVEKSGGPYLRETSKFKCASAIYQGPLKKIGEVWGAFVGAAMQKGEPTGESRELFLYYESAESPNNIVELQMGLK
jgi:effector-binding domain-containing protein